MSAVANMFDPYERRARFYPMLLVVMPAALGLASWLPAGMDALALAESAVLGVGLAAFLSQLARDQGKKKEPGLFQVWGGKPSVRALSYGGGFFDGATVARHHRKLKRMDPDLVFPKDAQEEAKDLGSATAAYASANELLLSRTRDRERFRLVFEENVNYGYRRNLWAMKTAGIVTASLGLVAGGARAVRSIAESDSITAAALLATGVSAGLLVLWIVRVKPAWVRVAANAYARQLASASAALEPQTVHT